MNKEEYLNKTNKLIAAHKELMRIVNKKYLKSVNNIHTGDIIESDCCRIRVDFTTYFSMCVEPIEKPRNNIRYRGIRLTTKNVPYKSNEVCEIFACDVKRVFKKGE